MRLMVLDGNSIINRAYYGVSQSLTTREGQPTNAVYGFLNILNKLLDEAAPDAVCVTFDRKAPTFRHLAYEGYKANRKGMPEELASQMPILKRVLSAMNLPMYELDGWEADDLLGTIARLDEAAGWETVIVTGDKDSLQLITDHRKAGVHPHGPHLRPGHDTRGVSGGVRVRSHSHHRPEGADGGRLGQHPRGEGGGGKNGHPSDSAVSYHHGSL